MHSIDVIPAHIIKPDVCYRRAKIFGGALTRPYGVKLDQVTTQRWVEATSLFRIIDNYIDGSADELAERIEHVQHQLDDPSSLEAYYPSLLPESLGKLRFDQIQRFGKQIVRLNHHVKSATTEERYMRLRQFEGRQSAHLLIGLASEEMINQDHFARFAVGLEMIGETLNLADTFVDLGGDRRRGELGFEPSSLFRARLLGRSASRFAHYVPLIVMANKNAGKGKPEVQ